MSCTKERSKPAEAICAAFQVSENQPRESPNLAGSVTKTSGNEVGSIFMIGQQKQLFGIIAARPRQGNRTGGELIRRFAGHKAFGRRDASDDPVAQALCFAHSPVILMT